MEYTGVYSDCNNSRAPSRLDRESYSRIEVNEKIGPKNPAVGAPMTAGLRPIFE